jgi:hypothetical protein
VTRKVNESEKKMSGLFGKLDKNSSAKSTQSGPASLSSEKPSRKSYGLFAG